LNQKEICAVTPSGRESGGANRRLDPAAEFDHYSTTYLQLVDKSVCLSGEGAEYFAELKARYLGKFLGPAFSGKVLDFGCGIGLLSRFLLSSLPNCALHGYDMSRASLELIPPDVSSRGKFTSLQDELHSDYDLIVVANVMHHIPSDLRRLVITDLKNRLAPGGILAAFEHNPLNPLTRLAVKECPFDQGVILLWPRELLNYFSDAGLLVHRCDYITFFPRWLACFRPLEPRLSWCPFGAQYVVLGEKAQKS
jgi:SAM-dependent methyltransferase